MEQGQLIALMSGVIATSVMSVVWFLYARNVAHTLPFLPSYVENIRNADAATRYFAAVHDLAMLVTEAWNSAQARSDVGVEQAIRREELEPLRERLLLGEQELRADLQVVEDVYEDAAKLKSQVSGCWSYEVSHHYRTQSYTTTTTGSDGKRRTVRKTRKVYDHSIHTYRYSHAHHDASEALLKRWLAKVELPIPQPNVGKRKVDVSKLAPGERDLLTKLVQLTVLEDEDAEVDDELAQGMASQWLSANRLDEFVRAVRNGRRAIQKYGSQRIGQMRSNNPHYRFKTNTKTHSGPQGYHAYQMLMAELSGITQAWQSVDGLFFKVQETLEELRGYALDDAVIEGDREYAKLAISVYEAAFPNATIEINQIGQPLWLILLISTIAGAFVGAFMLLIF